MYPGNVFANNVEFDVYLLSRFQFLYIGVLHRIRNNCYRKAIFCNIENGEADAIQTNRSFLNNQLSKIRVYPKAVLVAPVFVFNRNACRRIINMALYHMTVESAIHQHTTFKIYEIANAGVGEIRFKKGFANSGNLVHAAGYGLHRKTNAIMANTLIGLQFSRNRRGNIERCIRFVRSDVFDNACRFDDSGKHACKLTCDSPTSRKG